MLVNAATPLESASSSFDICIIGGGAAGLVLASEFTKCGREVVILESGDRQPNPDCEALISGHSTGFTIAGQRRRFGGSLTDWGANCAVLDPADFRHTDVPDLMNWPFGENELAQRTDRAAEYLGVATENNTLAGTGLTSLEPWGNTSASLAVKEFATGDVNQADKLAVKLARNDCRVVIQTRATVLGFDLEDSAKKVTAVRYALADGTNAKLTANTVILAAGIENGPILLRGLSENTDITTRRWPALGRYLHSHLLSLHGIFHAAEGISVPDKFCLGDDLGPAAEGRKKFFGLRAGLNNVPNSVSWLTSLTNRSALVPKSFARAAKRPQSIWARFQPRRMQPELFAIRHFMEQPARASSRVRLGPPKGPLHLQEPIWDWGVGAQELQAMDAVRKALDHRFQTLGLGRIGTGNVPLDRNGAHIKLNAHPMGGTIAGSDPLCSVVDKDLKMHGLDNLFVCGGSVIPRGGSAMVTTVIVQLALRLADHIIEECKP